MKQITTYISKAIQLAFLPTVLTFMPCWGGLSFELIDFVTFSKSSTTIENLDSNNYKGTALTSGWSESKRNIIYEIEAEAVYVDDCTKIYGLLAFAYGWVLDGKTISYPLGWRLNGHTKGWALETGYIYSFCKNFDLTPHVGWEWGILDTKIKHQHFVHTTPDCVIKRNGDHTSTFLYGPYAGLDAAFQATLCEDFKVNVTVGYDFSYSRGHGTLSVSHFFLTDDPGTSRYGQRVKYRDMISHEFKLAVGHYFADHWQGFLEFVYSTTYNTHKLPVKLQHNKEIVETGQFTPTQFHRVSDSISQSYTVSLGIVYRFDVKGTSDVIIR